MLDELQIHLVPILLGGGRRFLDHVGATPRTMEAVRVLERPGVTHLKYRVGHLAR